MKYPSLALAAVVLIAATPTPPPPPPAITAPAPVATAPVQTATAAPEASASPAASAPPASALDSMFGYPTPAAGAPASATPTPPPDTRKGLDGVWEVQIQRGPTTEYTHFNVKQSGTALTGTYLTTDKKRFPIAGSLDGTTVRLVVSLPDGSTILLEGRVDGTTDMLGMFTDAKERVPFTAAYRPKEKWIENINAQPGGLGGGMGGPGGGYPPSR